MGEQNRPTGSHKDKTKISRIARKYALDDVTAELVRRRRGNGGDGLSLRELELYFNQRVLQAALEQAGETPLDGEVNNTYRLLTSDEVTEGTRIEARRRLERIGVDVTAVEDDFVSYQTINRFLDAHPEISDSESNEDPITEKLERLFKLESRLSAVTTSTLERLRTEGGFSMGEFEVYVAVTVTCTDCGARRSLRELLTHRGCDC